MTKDTNETADQKKARAESQAKVETVNKVIDDRTSGGPDAIGETETERQSREERGRQMRGEPQDAPVATDPLEPSVERLHSHRKDLETSATAGDLAQAKARQDKEAVEGASLNYITDKDAK